MIRLGKEVVRSCRDSVQRSGNSPKAWRKIGPDFLFNPRRVLVGWEYLPRGDEINDEPVHHEIPPVAASYIVVLMEGARMSSKDQSSKSEQLDIMKGRVMASGTSRRDVIKGAAAIAGGAAIAAAAPGLASAAPGVGTR